MLGCVLGAHAAPSPRETLFSAKPEKCSNQELVDTLVPKIKEQVDTVVPKVSNEVQKTWSLRDVLREPILNGVLPGKHRPKVIIAQDINYPPCAATPVATAVFERTMVLSRPP